MINFTWCPFSELTVEQLYAMLMLRADVFVVDQNCAYLDPDGKDFFALHLLGMKNNTLIAYIRLFPPKDDQKEIIFGRVVIAKSMRRKGHGKKLMQELLAYCDNHFPGIAIKCSAQHYLEKFYQGFGFKSEGEIYEEEGIPHVTMQRKASSLY